VNHKIEGFYQLCKSRGLKGDESVMIPRSNVEDLMLKEEVVKAVKDGKFHIYPVSNIDEGIEVLTDVRAGKRKADGTFEPDSVNFKVDRRLRTMAEALVKFGERPSEAKGAHRRKKNNEK
jgi:predicted ATP-dependent protease